MTTYLRASEARTISRRAASTDKVRTAVVAGLGKLDKVIRERADAGYTTAICWMRPAVAGRSQGGVAVGQSAMAEPELHAYIDRLTSNLKTLGFAATWNGMEVFVAWGDRDDD